MTPLPQTLQSLIASVQGIVNSLIPILFAVGVLVFFWGIVRYIFAAGNEGAKAEGKQVMIWGVIALFVMSAVWGLVTLIRQTLGVGDQSTIQVPKITP
jgi:hypothetical protein